METMGIIFDSLVVITLMKKIREIYEIYKFTNEYIYYQFTCRIYLEFIVSHFWKYVSIGWEGNILTADDQNAHGTSF